MLVGVVGGTVFGPVLGVIEVAGLGGAVAAGRPTLAVPDSGEFAGDGAGAVASTAAVTQYIENSNGLFDIVEVRSIR